MAATITAPARAQARLNRMVGRSSGFIETLPRAVRGRIDYLRSLQEKHDDLEEEYNTELRALEAKYDALYGVPCYRLLASKCSFKCTLSVSSHCSGQTHAWAGLKHSAGCSGVHHRLVLRRHAQMQQESPYWALPRLHAGRVTDAATPAAPGC